MKASSKKAKIARKSGKVKAVTRVARAGAGKKAASGRAASKQRSDATPSTARSAGAQQKQPKLLSGGNPQIAKGDGDAPVQAYIASMPDWKREVGQRLDALVTRKVPGVRKAVRWNTPFYGVEGQGWFLGFHCFARYVKLTFLRGSALSPMPPVASKDPHVRYFHIDEEGDFDEKSLARWIEQAAKLPGDPLF